jgi:5-methylcytosine-specific restriction endonuclease McrA
MAKRIACPHGFLSLRSCLSGCRDRRRQAQAAEWYKGESNKERVRVLGAAWRLANPERAKTSIESWRLNNRARRNAVAAKWIKANPEFNQEKSRRRRARVAGNGVEPVTKAHLKLLFDAQDGCCRYCRTPLGEDKHLDHRIPIARGGPHAPSNVCWSCPSCNLKKNVKTEQEFLNG